MKSSIGTAADVAAAGRPMPAVTVPPRPNGLPTASTQSPILALPSDSLANGKSEPPSTLIRARSVRESVPITFGYRFSCVGRDFNFVGAFNDMVVGHGITIGRDEESLNPGPSFLCADHRDRAFAVPHRGPPNWRKKRSIGEPDSSSSLFSLASVAFFIVTLTEITEGFTRSTMSAKPAGWATLETA